MKIFFCALHFNCFAQNQKPHQILVKEISISGGVVKYMVGSIQVLYFKDKRISSSWCFTVQTHLGQSEQSWVIIYACALFQLSTLQAIIGVSPVTPLLCNIHGTVRIRIPNIFISGNTKFPSFTFNHLSSSTLNYFPDL